jgi:hypothetical protein
MAINPIKTNKTMKTTLNKPFLLGVLSTLLIYSLIVYILSSISERHPPENVSKHIDTEYFLEVSEDSIWIESKQGDVYSGTYSQLDSLINVDNL